jgi:hypothetical protein
MDDEATKLLREMRDILVRNEARDTAYMERNLDEYKTSNARMLKFTKQNAMVIWILLGGLASVLAFSIYLRIR